jgi:hypothetical protein
MNLRSGVKTGQPRSRPRKHLPKVAKNRRQALVYRTLQQITSEIRLLQILPSASALSTVNCRLNTVSLEDSPEYVALSYLWGDPTVTRNIRVNDCVIPVTTGLESALRQIRATLFGSSASESVLRDLPSQFWIDAVCINLHDVQERSHQVQLMRKIYQQASSVLVWLGPREDELLYGMAAIDRMGREINISDDRKTNLDWMSEWPELWEINCRDNVSNKAWNAIDELHRLDYWKRVWTFQERVLAKRLWFMVGPCIVDGLYFDEIKMLLENIQSGAVPKPAFVSHKTWWYLSSGAFIKTDKRNFFKEVITNPGEKSDNLRAFFVTFEYHATDPRDKIYAVLGLFDHLRNDISLLPDYSISVESLYCDFGRAYIRSTGNNELLRYSGLGHEMPRSYDLPSWAPDWDGISKSDGFAYPIYGFNTGGELHTHVNKQSFFGEKNELHTYGSICDSVSRIEPIMWYDSDEFALFCWAYCPLDGRASYKTGIPPLQAVFYTLIMMDPKLNGENSGSKKESNRTLAEMIWFFNDILRILQDKSQDEEGLGIKKVIWDLIAYSVRCSQDPSTGLPSVAMIRDEVERDITKFSMLRKTLRVLSRYRLFHTSDGYLGLAPPNLLPGDLICAVQNCSFPILLRKEGSHYVHVGACFVLGLMNGEAEKLIEEGHTSIQEFVIF